MEKPQYIGFVARSLTKSERNYGTTKRELLAIVLALQKFHTYLWGRHLILRTDHKALVFIHTQKDLNAMLTNWFDTIFNYTFTVVHLPGIDNVLPDSLSCLFHSKKELGEGNVDKFHSSQYVMRKIDRANRKATIAYLAEHMLEPPTGEKKQEILEKAHLFGHFGAETMVKAIHNKVMHWPKLMEQALAVAKKCSHCRKFNIVKTGYNPHRPVRSFLPGDHWAIDLAGPLPLTERNNRYMLVMIDICSRFVIRRSIPNKTAEAVVKALIPVFCDFGIPRIVQSDNGKNLLTKS